MTYEIVFTKDAQKDLANIKNANLSTQVKKLLTIIEKDPFAFPPSYEPLKGSYKGFYSRRINKQHRLIYAVKDNLVVIYSLWTHYEKF